MTLRHRAHAIPTHLLAWTCLVAVTIYSSCGQHAIAVQYRIVDEHTFSRSELSVIQTIADDSTREVRRLLPDLPDAPIP